MHATYLTKVSRKSAPQSDSRIQLGSCTKVPTCELQRHQGQEKRGRRRLNTGWYTLSQEVMKIFHWLELVTCPTQKG